MIFAALTAVRIEQQKGILNIGGDDSIFEKDILEKVESGNGIVEGVGVNNKNDTEYHFSKR